MAADRPPPVSDSGEHPAGDRLDSWKEIAAYLNRDVRTVYRWEKQEALPVHRHVHAKRGTVYAYKRELDTWLRVNRNGLETREANRAHARQRRLRMAASLAAVAVVAGGLLLWRWAAAPHPPITSLAVLPLENLTGDPEQEYLVDGLHEELITQLAQISSLKVIARGSVVGYKQNKEPLPDIARKLNVEVLLEGSVRRSGNRIRVAVQLIQASSQRHLWAKTYEQEEKDILILQNEVARAVTNELRPKLAPEEQVRLARTHPVKPEAYMAYLKGRAQFHQGPGPASLKAKEYFEKAIEEDPGYAAAYAGLAELYARGGRPLATDIRGPYWDLRPQARQLAARALELDDTLAEAHTALGWVKLTEWDWAGAEREFKRAIELNPNYPLAHIWYAEYLAAVQLRFDEATAEAQRAQQLDPVSPFINTRVGWIYLWAGRDDEAIAFFREVLELGPNSLEQGYAGARLGLAHVYLKRGMYQQAVAEIEPVGLGQEHSFFAKGTLAYAYAKLGRREEALSLVNELERRSTSENVPHTAIAYGYVGLGDAERAIACLEADFEHHRWLFFLNVGPMLQPLRNHARFHDLVHRVGLPHADAHAGKAQRLRN